MEQPQGVRDALSATTGSREAAGGTPPDALPSDVSPQREVPQDRLRDPLRHAVHEGPGEDLREALTEALKEAGWHVVRRTLLAVLAIVLGLWVLVQLQAVVIRVLLALILAAGMTPLVDTLTAERVRDGRRRWAPPRALVVLLLYALLLGTLGLAGALVLPPLAAEVEDLLRGAPGYAAALQGWVGTLPDDHPLLPTADLSQLAAEQLRVTAAQATMVLRQAMVLARVAFGGLLNTVFVFVLALYMTVDSARLQRYLVGFFPPDRRLQAARTVSRIGERLGGWLRGQLLLSAIVGLVTLTGLWLLGVRYATLLALVAAAGEAVPLVGPIFSAVPAIAVASFQSPVHGLLTLALYVLVQQLENHLLVPKVMERAVALHPLVVILALLAGSQLLGVAGAVLAVPVAAAVAVVVDEVHRKVDDAAD